jgi:uncharacterized protein (TIGR01244 family)
MNIARVNASLYVGPQLEPAHMPALVQAGVRSVVNNRPDGEGGPAQPTSAQLQAAAEAAGLEYRYLPVPPAGQSEADAREMARLVASLPPPVLAFCRSGRRSLALYQMGSALQG